LPDVTGVCTLHPLSHEAESTTIESWNDLVSANVW